MLSEIVLMQNVTTLMKGATPNAFSDVMAPNGAPIVVSVAMRLRSASSILKTLVAGAARQLLYIE